MNPVWEAEQVVDDELAAALIESQFPTLAPARVARLGEGWDNTVLVVNDAWVFRFPRRAIAVDLIRSEASVLPAIAPRLPLPIPRPELVGEPEERYPWPFAGYRLLPGRAACEVELDDAQRAASAAPLARFLHALHAIPADEARAAGARPDDLRRLDLPHRRAQLDERLELAAARGLVEDADAIRALAADVPEDWTPRADVLVHGDLYSCQLLVDGAGRVSGVIDWGDVHLGDPAIDLAVAWSFLPPGPREAFRAAYGPLDADAWRVARFKALHLGVVSVLYAHDRREGGLARDARAILEYATR